jgi:hypothetical protein
MMICDADFNELFSAPSRPERPGRSFDSPLLRSEPARPARGAPEPFGAAAAFAMLPVLVATRMSSHVLEMQARMAGM